MATISPNAFLTNGARKLSPAEYIARKKSLACALPKDNKPSCTGHVVKLFYILLQACLLSLMLSLTACKQPEKDIMTELQEGADRDVAAAGGIGITSYFGVNYTDKSIISIIVNGEGGVIGVDAHNEDGGGADCCISLPRKWHPGVMVTIKWQLGGTYQLDSKGHRVIEDGVPVVIEGEWKTKTVEVPKYEGKDETGYLNIFFYPNDEVKLKRINGNPW